MQSTSDVQLDGQVAVVTGGTAGIGKAVCLALAGQGANVVIVGRDGARLERTVLEIERQGRGSALGARGDVRDERDMENMAEAAVERFGRIDILIAAAGILRLGGSTLKTLVQMPLAEWDEVVDTNLKGVFLSNRAVLPIMIRQRGGHIINLSSTSGRKGYAFDTAYCASKFGVIGFTEAVAEEASEHDIKVHALLPGAIDTPMWDQNGPIGRPGFALPVERVAELVLHMLVDAPDTTVVSPVIEPFVKPPRDGWLNAPGDLNPAQMGDPAAQQMAATTHTGRGTQV